MNHSELAKKIEELEGNEAPFVRIVQIGGGADESALEGNAEGFRKMAAGLLKLSDGDKNSGVEALLHETSDVFFEYCELKDSPPAGLREAPREVLKDKLIGYGLTALVFSVPVCWLIGVIFSVRWLLNEI